MPQVIIAPHRTVRCLALCLLACLSLRAFAQEPTDSDAWKSRCLSLGAHADAIDKGSAPPELLQSTHGIPGAKFAAVGYERGNAGQHYIACTMYYTAALAEHMGNGGKVDPGRAHTDVVLAGAEAKRATGLPLTFKEKMDRASGKLIPTGKNGLTPADLSTVYSAFGEGGPPAPSPPIHPADATPRHSPQVRPRNRLPAREAVPGSSKVDPVCALLASETATHPRVRSKPKPCAPLASSSAGTASQSPPARLPSPQSPESA